MPEAHIVVLGGRGSIPVSGPDFVRYGGNTSCFAFVVDGAAVAFVDAGTGLVSHPSYGIDLAPSVNIFLTHYHWDHIQGLSMFDELWSRSCDVCVRGPGDPAAVLTTAIAPPVFPVSIGEVSTVHFEPMVGQVEVSGLRFSSFPLNHPQGGIGYRVDGPNRTVAIVTDHEAGTSVDQDLERELVGIDVLIHDAQYLPSEQEQHEGWGHSTYVDAVALATTLGVKELILTSHDPSRTDREIDATMSAVRHDFEAAFAAGQGMEVGL